MNGETQAAGRDKAPALSGRDTADQDPPVMEQWINEIKQATNYIDTQRCRIRSHSDSLFGSEPRNEAELSSDKKDMAEIRPQYDLMAQAINTLHAATQELSQQMDRLEGHRLV